MDLIVHEILGEIASREGTAAVQKDGVFVYFPIICVDSTQQDVLWCMQELKSSVILDLGCLKSVAGTQWINQLVGRWKAQGRWFKVFEEKEVFRFGNGETLTSRYGLMVHCTFAGKDVILNFSVVKGDCPPLLSRPACTQLGIIFDCSLHTLSSRKLQVKQYGLTQNQWTLHHVH